MPNQMNFLTEFAKNQEISNNLKQSLHTQFDVQGENGKPLQMSEITEKAGEITSLFWCLQEVLKVCDAAIAKQSSRELSIVKTKLEEAEFWLDKVAK